jgi:ankyrin repeat protein
MRDIASYIDPSTRVGQRIKYFQPSISLLAFQSLLPGEVSQEQYQYNLNSTATNAILETNFTQLLVFSMTNGLAGLRDMPIAGVFKFLKRYGSVSAVFGQILQASPRYVAKSLAENLFKVAIEAKESDIVMQLLRTPFVKANQIIFHVKGCRLTVAERSAQLRDLKTLEILLQAGADVNRTFKKDPIHGGVLKHLVSSIRRGETVPDVIHMIQTLLQAGAKVYAGMLRHVVEQLRHSHLALCLLPSLLPTHDTDLVSNGIMPLITLELDEEEACEATHQILTVCNLYHSRRCFEESESEIEWTLIESAKRGHSQVVRELLPYSRSLHRVLSASFRGGEREIIDMILARHSDFSSPAHSIEYSPIERALSRSGSDYAIGINHEPLPEPNKSPTLDETTPLAEAIMTTADDIIQICETAGALDHIRLDGHFRAALTAAAITGNLPYVRKLLQHGPSPSYDYYSVISTALSQSIKHGHDDITFELFQEGAVMGAGSNNILLAAFKARNAAIAHVMLTKYAVRRSTVNLAELFEEAIRWGDRSIIMDLHHIYAEYTIKRSSSFEKPMKATSESLLNFLVDLNLVENSALTQFLAAPIKTGDSAMVSRLMDLGAEPSDSANLHLAAIHHSGILKILLEHIPRSGKPCTNLGTYAVMQTVRLGFAGLESLEILLSSEVVDFRSFAYKFHDKDQRNPLGWAIEGAVYYNGGFPVVKRLLEAGCDPNSIVATPDYNSSTDCNMTALLAAICTRIVGVVGLLLTFGADVNTQATRGLTRTPLQLAAELGCLEIVQLLIEEGAHVNALPTQRRGGTSLQLAAISGNCNIAAELLSHGADPEAPPSFIDGRWPIEGAAEHGRLDMIEYLLKVTVYNEEKCERAMELARKNGHMGCHDLIAEHVEKQKSRGQNDLMSLDCTIAPFLV